MTNPLELLNGRNGHAGPAQIAEALASLATLLTHLPGRTVARLEVAAGRLEVLVVRPARVAVPEPSPAATVKPLTVAPPTHRLSPIQQAVLDACTAEPQTSKVIARKADRSAGRVREAIAQLVELQLLDRTPRGICLRRKEPQR